MKAGGIDHHAEFLQIMRVAELMQRERLIDRRGLAHHIDRAVDRFLCQLQRKGGLCRDPLRQRHHEGREFGPRHHVIDHAEPVRFLRAPDVGGEQQFLGLARAEFPGMHEPFDAADAHGDHGIAEFRVVAGDDEVAGPGQHQAAGDAFAVHFRDRRLGEIAPAPRDLQIDFLLAREAAMGVGLGEAAPISDRRKIDAGGVLAAGAQIVPGREMRTVAGEDDDLDRVVLHRLVEGGVEIVGHLQVLRVARLGPVHHDPRDARLRPLHDDGLERPVVFMGSPCIEFWTMLTISANDRQEPSAAK